MAVHPERIKLLKPAFGRPKDEVFGEGPVLYWMSRNQRAADNWSLLYAQELALRHMLPLFVTFCVVPAFSGARRSHYRFMLEGLAETAGTLGRLGIPFIPLFGMPKDKISELVSTVGASALVLDFDPLREKREWYASVCVKIDSPVYEVDGRNVVPVWTTSDKQEYAARTIRPKIHRLLPEFLEEYPSLEEHASNGGAGGPREGGSPGGAAPGGGTGSRGHPEAPREGWSAPGAVSGPYKKAVTWERLFRETEKLPEGPDLGWIEPGEAAARRRLQAFIDDGLSSYHLERNDPTKAAASGLSPYLHFGQLSSARAVLEVRKAAGGWRIGPGGGKADGGGRDTGGKQTAGIGPVGRETIDMEGPAAFLEELIVRRELADNYCRYNSRYDSVEGFPDWARKTLDDHREDKREYIYSLEELEGAQTHDPLWNAAQIRLVRLGTMHGYLRMYWAKKIYEWSGSPEDAVEHAIYLNDAYQLDGRDPNGYTGVAWAVGGVHDRPWAEREVFGKVRYMNYSGCKRKFDVEKYIKDTAGL